MTEHTNLDQEQLGQVITLAPITAQINPQETKNAVDNIMTAGTTSLSAPNNKEYGPSSHFKSYLAELGFCFSIAMTQLLSEVLISGFALVLVKLIKNDSTAAETGSFWPAALLSLIVSSTLLVWARLADMYGGFLPVLFGLLWLMVWTIVPGFVNSMVVLDISRAMQGLAISAFAPAVFVLLGDTYEENQRKTLIIGIYGACAPLGFYIGFVIGAMLPEEHVQIFFLIVAVLAFLTSGTTYLSVPGTSRYRHNTKLTMDWLGAFFITCGLILVAYALAVEPYKAKAASTQTAFSNVGVYVPLIVGLLFLFVAIWIEGWYANCPLLPFDFFRVQGVKVFCTACLFFYGSFGVWMYYSCEYFDLMHRSGPNTTLVLWYTPLVVGGILFCVAGSTITSIVPMKILLAVSGLAWVIAPLLLALSVSPLQYFPLVLMSMLCTSLGVDLTFTISNLFLSSSQPQQYQGLAGAISSILFNLGISFALPLSQIVFSTVARGKTSTLTAYQVAFWYGVASAVAGLVLCIFLLPNRCGSKKSRSCTEVVEV